MSTKIYTDKSLEEMWIELTDVPFDENETGELILAEDWASIFSKGDSREAVWHWFDEMHSKGVAWLLNEFEEEMSLEEAIEWCSNKNLTINFYGNSHVEVLDGLDSVSGVDLLDVLVEFKKLELKL